MQTKQDKMIYAIIWEYVVKAEHTTAFEEIYSAHGTWAKLFQKSKGYLETELLHDANTPYRYVTIDRWISVQEYEAFLSQWKTEYAALDAQCNGLTENETLLGYFETILGESR